MQQCVDLASLGDVTCAICFLLMRQIYFVLYEDQFCALHQARVRLASM